MKRTAGIISYQLVHQCTKYSRLRKIIDTHASIKVNLNPLYMKHTSINLKELS